MLSEIVGSSVNEAVGGFSVFLATRISHSICAFQVSSYVVFISKNNSGKKSQRYRQQCIHTVWIPQGFFF
jgi:hypothetical protein